MKKLLPLAALTLIACNKPKCWTCTSTVTNITSGYVGTNEIKVCDKTKSQIKDDEKRGNKNWYTVNPNGDTIYQSSTYNCK